VQSRTLAVAVSIAMLGTATADAGVLEEFEQLDVRRLTPAPLVPTTAPRALRPLDRALERASTRRASGYAFRLANADNDAIIALEAGQYRTMGAVFRDARRLSFRRARARVRGRRGYLLTRPASLGPITRWLAWVEDGRVYVLATGTPRKVSLNDLRATADGLEKLTGAYGGTPDPATSTEAFAATTARTVTARVSWEAQCTDPGATESYARVGTAEITLLRRAGSAFQFDIAENLSEPEPWTGRVSGTVAPDAVGLNLRAAGTIAGSSCDTGPMSFSIPRSRRRG
jgi:hypothetical protein